MKVQDLMTRNPACCSPDTSLREVARMMVDCDCGEIPVVDRGNNKPIGVITDRDITVRTVANGRNPLELCARDCMTHQVVAVRPDDDFETAADQMQKHQIRRILVVDESGRLCGIVAQADVARTDKKRGGDVVKAVSKPAGNRPEDSSAY